MRADFGPPGFYSASRPSSTVSALLPGSWMLLGHEEGLGGEVSQERIVYSEHR
jgi:hypothetical protein